jgi:hypothetical protein
MNKTLIIPFNAPLNELDSIIQTYGCRQKNPDICGNNSLPCVCAFVTDDCICRKPSRAWKRQYEKLKLQTSK